MKLSDLIITRIQLSHDEAVKLKQQIIDAIEKHGIENFETRKEIEIEKEDSDIISIYVDCEIYTEYKGSFQSFNDPPEPDEILSRSVMTLKIQLINMEGDKVEYKVLGERCQDENSIWYTKTPIDIEEEIIKYFTI